MIIVSLSITPGCSSLFNVEAYSGFSSNAIKASFPFPAAPPAAVAAADGSAVLGVDAAAAAAGLVGDAHAPPPL